MVPEIKYKYISELNCFFLESFGNQAVEFSLPWILEQELMQCRLYYKKGFFIETGEWVDFERISLNGRRNFSGILKKNSL